MRKLTTEEFVQRARAVHGSRYDYSKAVYEGTDRNIEIICPVHGSFQQTPARHLNGNGCPACGHIRSREKLTKPAEDFIAEANEVHKGKYDYSQVVYVNTETKVTIVCPIHGSFQQTPVQHLYGRGCPKCGLIVASTQIVSKLENKIYDKLAGAFGEEDVLRQQVTAEYPFCCDFLIASRQAFIECNSYWVHGRHPYDPQSPADAALLRKWTGKSQEAYRTAIKTWTRRDPEKRAVAKANGLNFLEFWDWQGRDVDEWIAAGCPDGHDYDSMYSWKQ